MAEFAGALGIGLGVGMGLIGIGFPATIIGIAVAALVVVLWVAIDLIDYGRVKCTPLVGVRSCAAGAVYSIHRSYSGAGESFLPFLAFHNRVDLLVLSVFWDRVEAGASSVICTGEDLPRRSELMQCWYQDPTVCAAHNGGIVGLGVGALVGAAAGIAIAAAIGCATVILCLLALLLAVIAVIVLAIIGAAIGGNIGKAAAESDAPPMPEDRLDSLAVGDLITVWGNMTNVGPNIFWFVDETAVHGHASASVPLPYSYCEIDEELVAGTDLCYEIE